MGFTDPDYNRGSGGKLSNIDRITSNKSSLKRLSYKSSYAGDSYRGCVIRLADVGQPAQVNRTSLIGADTLGLTV